MSRAKVGDPVPSFSLTADDDGVVSDEALAGRRYVLYFYPKDDTPGCTVQACSLRDEWDRVAATGSEIFGVSPDSVASHVKFRAKYDLPYRLLSDEGHRLADALGVWVEKSFAGRTFKGIERTTFVISGERKIEHVLARVKPGEHVDQLLEVLTA